MSFLYGVRSYHCEKIHFVQCYTFKKQECNIEHLKNNIPSILESQDIASHVDQVLLEKLEATWALKTEVQKDSCCQGFGSALI